MNWKWEDFKVDLPEGSKGDWKVRHFEVTEEAAAFEGLRAVINGSRRAATEGLYTGLYQTFGNLNQGGEVVMSDTMDEILDHFEAYRQSCLRGGNILIHGLGLGMITSAICELPHVNHVTVVEVEGDVIDLVAPTLLSRYDNLTIVEEDSLTWTPVRGSRFQVVWHDIWTNIDSNNLPQMRLLHERYRRRTEWQGAWSRDMLQGERRRYNDA